jgi:hypothetical protein
MVILLWDLLTIGAREPRAAKVLHANPTIPLQPAL